MAYFVDLFSPETYEAFTKSGHNISGFRLRQENATSRVKIGDKLICYMTKLSRWGAFSRSLVIISKMTLLFFILLTIHCSSV